MVVVGEFGVPEGYLSVLNTLEASRRHEAARSSDALYLRLAQSNIGTMTAHGSILQ